MDNTRQLPEPVRKHLASLGAAAQQAKVQLDNATIIACNFLEIDPTWPNHIDLDTGVVYVAVDAKTRATPPAATPPATVPGNPWTLN